MTRSGSRRIVGGGIVAVLLALLVASATSATPKAGPVTITLASGGSRNDGSWTQAWYEGSLQGQKEVGSKAKVTFLDPPDTTADYDHAAAAALGSGQNIFVFATAEVPQLTAKYAKQFPNSMLGDVEPPLASYPKNQFSVLPRFQEGTFRAGVLAAEVSKKKHIGVIGAFDFPILTSELESFILGARYVDPSITISRTYINSFTDPAKGLAAAKAQIAAGADVLFSGTDQATQGIYKAAEASPGTLVITQYFDTYKQAPDVILTSVIYNLQGVAEKIIKMAADHTLKNTSYSFGLKDTGVGQLAPYHGNAKYVTAAAKAKLAQVTSAIEAGKLCVPGPEALGKTGSGSKADPQTAVKCK
jgi:basic membrane protein A